jgi:hypothetical protein
LRKIAFPNVESWKITGHLGLLEALDPDSIRTLDFECLGYPLGQIAANFSTQLTKLVLKMVAFTLGYRPNDQPQGLPCLTHLELENVVFQGVLQDYITCPNLEKLSFHYVGAELDDLSIDTETDELKEECSHEMLEIFDEQFFQGVPKLKYVSILGGSLDDSFLSNLRPCTRLETMVIEECYIEYSISSFLEFLENLPNLMTVRIEDSWPQHSDMSYQEFITRCVSERPGTCVYGNGRPWSTWMDVVETYHPGQFSNSRDEFPL